MLAWLCFTHSEDKQSMLLNGWENTVCTTKYICFSLYYFRIENAIIAIVGYKSLDAYFISEKEVSSSFNYLINNLLTSAALGNPKNKHRHA